MGNNAQGWMLGPTGIKWVHDLDMQGVATFQVAATFRRDSIQANQQAERARLRSTTAYSLYVADNADSISRQDFYRFARVNEYFQTRARKRRYAIIDSAVAGDDTLAGLWGLLRGRFQEDMA